MNRPTAIIVQVTRTLCIISLALTFGACQDPFAAGTTRAYKFVATGGEHSCALTVDGVAYCWGRGLDGELGTGTKENRSTPSLVTGNISFSEITAGDNHTCALATNGTAYCWGWNAFYQRGNPTDPQDADPVLVTTNVKFRAISAGTHHTCALSIDSLAYCWGYNRYGQAGVGSTNTVITPSAVLRGIKFKRVSAGGNHACGVAVGGQAYCWGSNEFGQLGNGSSALFSTAPDSVRGNIPFTQIDAGTTHTCGVADERLYCWGSNVHGELGNGGVFRPGLPGASTPAPLSDLFPLGEMISAGANVTCAIRSTAGRCWGRGDLGQLGNGSFLDMYQPQPVILPGGFFPVTLFAAGGSTHTCALVEKAIYCWGRGSAGQLGVSGSTVATLPQRVSD